MSWSWTPGTTPIVCTMHELYMANLLLEERESIMVVVCISHQALKGLPSRKHSWERVAMASGHGTLVVFYKREAWQGRVKVEERRCATGEDFLQLTCGITDVGGRRGADTLPTMRMFATITPCYM